MKEIKKLLAIRLSALGDICMTLPVLDSFCRAYPDVEVTLLTTKLGAIIATSVINQPNFNVRSINKKDYSGLFGLNKLYAELKPLQFDAVADLHSVLRSKWIDFRYKLAGFPVKVIDKGRKEKKDLVAHRLDLQLTDGFERYRAVFAELGFSFAVDYDGKSASSRLTSPALEIPAPSIGIAPFAQHQGKIYPQDKMRAMIEALLQKRPDLHIYLFGSKEEAPVLEEWRSAHPEQIVNLAGAQKIDEDLRVMSKLQAMVSMDSANMHMASLVGLRCFSFWGATHRNAGFLGYGQKEEDCIEVPLPCRPCSIYGNKPCQFGDYHCMNDIHPDKAAEQILKALA